MVARTDLSPAHDTAQGAPERGTGGSFDRWAPRYERKPQAGLGLP